MSQTKSVSIPERAREIAHQMADSVAIPLWAHESCVKNFVIVIESALHSERELCAKELEEIAEDVVRGGTTLSNMEMAVLAGSIGHLTKVLRDGGK